MSEIADIKVNALNRPLVIGYLADYLDDESRLEIDEEPFYDWGVSIGWNASSTAFRDEAATKLCHVLGFPPPRMQMQVMNGRVFGQPSRPRSLAERNCELA